MTKEMVFGIKVEQNEISKAIFIDRKEEDISNIEP